MTDKNEILEYLQSKYPEDLNDNYKCYWWYVQSNDGELNPTFCVSLYDKFCETDKGLKVCLRKDSENYEYLEELIQLYIKEN